MNTLLITNPNRRLSLGKKLLCSVLLLAGLQTNSSAQYVKIGSGTGSNGVSEYPTPYGGANSGQRAQYLYLASELTAAGVTPGWIDTLGFNVLNTNSAGVHTSLKFYVDGTTTASLPQTAGTWLGPTTLRYYNAFLGAVPKLGWNNFAFSEPFYWNGTDNIVVTSCFWNTIDNKNASTEWTKGLAFNGSRTVTVPASSTSSDITSVCNSTAAATTGIDPTSRPNIHFFVHSTACSGAPEAGTALSSVGKFCYNPAVTPPDSFTLSLTGNTLGTGLSFQWQFASALAGPWSNYGVATTTVINRRAAQIATAYYRCIVTCIASGLKDTSYVAAVTQAPPYECDCASSSTDNTQEKILSVSLNTLSNVTPCSVVGGFYGDYTTTIPATNLEPDKSYTLTMRLGSCDPSNNDRAVKVFIDFNQNANYEVSEMVYANTYSAAQPNPQNAIGTFLVPALAKTGRTGMRIIYGQGPSLASIADCKTYHYGETQDYAVNILPFGAPTVTGRLEVCEHDSVVMNASSPADTPVVYNWTGPGGFTGVGPKITFVDAAPSLSGTYHVTVTSGSITSSPRDVEVIVHPKPAIPNVLNQVMCQYESPSKLITDGKNVIWYNVPVGGFGDTVAPTMLTYTPNSATYYLTQTVNGCTSDRGVVTVNVLLKPAPPIVKSPISYCQLQETDLAAKGENLKWYLDSTGGVPSAISPIPPTSGPDTIVYYVSQTVNGCESDRAKLTVYVYEQPNGIILQTKPYVCQYDTASFIYFGNAPVSYNYKWWADENVLISGSGQGPVTFKFDEAGDKVISLYVNNGNCATFKLTDTITVRPAPTAVINPTLNACVDVPVSITIDTATPYVSAYDWSWSGGVLHYETENGGPYGVSWGTPGTKVIKLVVTARSCPSLPIYDTLVVQEQPNAKILRWDRVTENGADTSAITGKICSKDTILFVAYHDSSYTYKWSPPFYFVGADTSYRAVDRMRVPAFIRVDVTNKYGCMSADSIYINAEPCCNIYMPNAFTPNNDTRNDFFKPVTEGRQEIITFRIMNRWGNEVFESANSDDRGWDGTYGGTPQDMGTYNYYLKYRCIDGNIYEMKGDLILIR